MVLKIRSDEKSVAANSQNSLTYEISSGRVFRVSKISYKSTGAFKINSIKDSRTGTDHLSGSIHSDQLKEDNGNVFKLPVELELTGATKLVIEVEDTSGAANTVNIALIGDESEVGA